jgi:DnaJ like chaperone protein
MKYFKTENMSWLGKVIGGAFGFIMGGPLGALLGAAVGHRFDLGGEGRGPFSAEVESAEQYRAQMAFFTATFAVMGHIAKVDGRVNEAEIAAARRIMQRLDLNEDMRKTAMRLFTEGKQADFRLGEVLEQFHRECRSHLSLTRMFIEIQLEAALADGRLQPTEEHALLQVCERLRFSRFEFHTLKALLEAQLRSGGAWRTERARAQASPREAFSLNEAYAILGVDASSGNDDIRRAYRRLLSQCHPDKLAAQGASEEKIRLANEKTRQLRKAWENVRKERGI